MNIEGISYYGSLTSNSDYISFRGIVSKKKYFNAVLSLRPIQNKFISKNFLFDK